MTSYPAARLSMLTLRSSLVLAAAAAVVAVSGCSDTGLSSDAEPVDQVEVEVVGVVTSDGQALADARVCSLYTPTAECAMSDGEGRFTMSVLSATPTDAARPMVALLVDAEGYEPVLYPESVLFDGDEAGTMHVNIPMLTELEVGLQALAAGVRLRDDRAHLLVEITPTRAETTARIWEGLHGYETTPTGDGSFYADDDGVLDPDLSATSSRGVFTITNMEPGLAEVGITRRVGEARCAMVQGFGGTGDDTFAMEMLPGRITYARAVCYDVPARTDVAGEAGPTAARS